MAGAIDIGSKSFEMTGPVGVGKGIRADFKITCRSAFLANGAKVMLTPSVTTDLVEFSPGVLAYGMSSHDADMA
ncbi:hypothetical protein AB5I41_31470 [Sphingomonas sp. MMS24-JH45]